MALLHSKLGESELSRKYNAVAKVKKMRDLNSLPPKSSIPKNFRTTQPEFKVEIIDFKNVNTKDQQLNSDQSDELYLDFIDFLLENQVYDLTVMALAYVNDKNTIRYLLTYSKIRVAQGSYIDAVGALDRLIA